MGLFFEDTKPPQAPPTIIQETKQDWLAVLVGGTIAIAVLLITGAGKVAWAILKPYIAWCMNIEGKSRQEALGRISCLVGPVLLTIVFIMNQFPSVWDFVSLSSTHTVNHTQDGRRIFFPDRSFFVETEARHIVHNDGTRIYASYAGYTKDTMQKVEPNQCQLVRRSKKIGFASVRPPVQAEGFKDEVAYIISLRISNLSWWQFTWYKLTEDRRNLFKGREHFAYGTVEREHSSSWKEFVDNWDSVWSPPNMHGQKPFEVRALWNEHAAACF